MFFSSLNFSSNLKINDSNSSLISFQGGKPHKKLTIENKKAIQESYYSGASLEDLSKQYEFSRADIAQAIDEADIVKRYTTTRDTMSAIGKEFFVTKQTVHNIVNKWGVVRYGDEYIKSILEAKESGMSTEDIIKLYGNNR